MVYTSDQQSVRPFVPAQDDKERFLMRHIQDTAAAAMGRDMPCYTDFLSDREQDLARAALHQLGCDCFSFQGGYPDAERCILCIEPPDTWQEEHLASLFLSTGRFSAQQGQSLRHQDILGALLGLGLDRGSVGDFLPDGQGNFFLFVLEDKADFICRELIEAGKSNVRCSRCSPEQAEKLPVPEHTLRTASLSSLRVDALLAAMLNCSRGTACEYLAAGRVEIGHRPEARAHAAVYPNDIITVRGRGRFKLVRIGGKSKKDRTFIEYFQY